MIQKDIWFQWISGGMYFGLRRIYLQPQIDDVFLASDVYDPTLSLQEQERSQTKAKIDGHGIIINATFLVLKLFLMFPSQILNL